MFSHNYLCLCIFLLLICKMDEKQNSVQRKFKMVRQEQETVNTSRVKMAEEKKVLDEKYKLLLDTIGKTPPPPRKPKE